MNKSIIIKLTYFYYYYSLHIRCILTFRQNWRSIHSSSNHKLTTYQGLIVICKSQIPFIIQYDIMAQSKILITINVQKINTMSYLNQFSKFARTWNFDRVHLWFMHDNFDALSVCIYMHFRQKWRCGNQQK